MTHDTDTEVDLICDRLIELHRQRQDLHKAEKSLTLQIKANCRRICKGDKEEAEKLYKTILRSAWARRDFRWAVQVLRRELRRRDYPARRCAMTDKITMDRQYTTRDGEPFELITVNGREPFPVLGYIGTDSEVTHLSATGKYYLTWDRDQREDGRDLIPAPVKRQGWVNLERSSDGRMMPVAFVYETYEDARNAVPGAIATVPIEWEE
jgi:hypothetical protein